MRLRSYSSSQGSLHPLIWLMVILVLMKRLLMRCTNDLCGSIFDRSFIFRCLVVLDGLLPIKFSRDSKQSQQKTSNAHWPRDPDLLFPALAKTRHEDLASAPFQGESSEVHFSLCKVTYPKRIGKPIGQSAGRAPAGHPHSQLLHLFRKDTLIAL